MATFIYRSAKTGKIVGEKYALTNPDSVVKEKVKDAPKPKDEAAVATPSAPSAPIWCVGDYGRIGESIVEITSLDPLAMDEHIVLNGVHSTVPVGDPTVEGMTGITRAEIIERLY